MNKEKNRRQKIEKMQNKLENDLKAAGYYDGKLVMIIVGINGLRVKYPEPNMESNKLCDLRPVHCRCSLIPQKD